MKTNCRKTLLWSSLPQDHNLITFAINVLDLFQETQMQSDFNRSSETDSHPCWQNIEKER